jgi:hypothetical protein
MDPVTIAIVAALSAGATAGITDTAKTAINDSWPVGVFLTLSRLVIVFLFTRYRGYVIDEPAVFLQEGCSTLLRR